MEPTITEQIVREAPEIEAYKLGLLKSAKTLSEEQLTLPAYQVAGLSPEQLRAIESGNAGIGAYQPYLTAGQAAIQQGIGSLSGAVGPATQEQLQAYMNPYQQAVIDTTLQEMRRQGDIAGQTAAAQAVKSGAFGSTREGVQRAEMERNLQNQMAQQTAQLNAQNYGQAQTLFGQNQNRMLQAGQLYGSLGVQQAALGEAAQRMGTQDINTLLGIGQLRQQNTQATLDAARATKLQESLAPYQQISFLSDIYKGAPSTQMALTSGSVPSTSPWLQAAGVGVAGVAAAAGAQKAGLF